MLRYNNCRYCRRLLHGYKFPLQTALPKYQHSATGYSYSLPPSSRNLDLQSCQQKAANWCECTALAKQNALKCLDCTARTASTGTSKDELSENIIRTLKSFLETIGSYNISDVLHDLPAQIYEMLLTSSTVLVIPSSGGQMCDIILSEKSREGMRRRQKCTRSDGTCAARLRLPTKRIVRGRENLPDESENGVAELVNLCSSTQNACAVASKPVSAIKGGFQLRTLKTSSCFTTVHDGASATALSCRGKVLKPSKEEDSNPAIAGTEVSMPERRAKIASVEHLKHLTLQKDIIGLQQVLSEERWPSYHRLKSFITELFDLFIEEGKDVQETVSLMDSFASANSRAVLPNSVILRLLRRIIREKGVKAAIDYAHHYRSLFLVKPPLNGCFLPHVATAAEDLFAEAFKREDCSKIQDLCDTMIDLGFFRNSSVYLCAAVESHLRSNGFETGFNLWYKNARKYRVGAGSDLLIRHTLLEKNLTDTDREKRLRNILEKLEEFGVFYDGLAELVLEMIKAGMVCEAELIMRRLKISGRHFKRPLFRLKNDEGNLPYIERFAMIFSTTLLEENRIHNTQRYSGHRSSLTEEDIAEDSHKPNTKTYIRSLLAIWQPRCKRKQKRKVEMKKFSADPEQLQGLIYATQNVWFELAVRAGDTESVRRLLTWITIYNGDGSAKLRKKIQDFFSGTNPPEPSNNTCDGSS